MRRPLHERLIYGTSPPEGEGLVVNEWTATATRDGQALEWDGIDVIPFENGLVKRKDVYTNSRNPRRVALRVVRSRRRRASRS